MNELKLKRVTVSEFAKMTGNFYVLTDFTEGVNGYVQVHKQSLIAQLRSNMIENVQIGVDDRPYRSTVLFIQGEE